MFTLARLLVQYVCHILKFIFILLLGWRLHNKASEWAPICVCVRTHVCVYICTHRIYFHDQMVFINKLLCICMVPHRHRRSKPKKKRQQHMPSEYGGRNELKMYPHWYFHLKWSAVWCVVRAYGFLFYLNNQRQNVNKYAYT